MVKPPKTMQPEAVQLDKAGRGITKAFTENSFHNYMARKIDLQRQQFGLVLPPPPPPPPPPPVAKKFAAESSAKTIKTISSSNLPTPIHKHVYRSNTKEPWQSQQQSSQPKRSDGTSKTNSQLATRRSSSKGFGIVSVLKRLQKRHGVVSRKRKRPGSYFSGLEESMTSSSASGTRDNNATTIAIAADQSHDCNSDSKFTAVASAEQSTSTNAWTHRRRELIFKSQQDQERSDLFLRGIVVMVNGYTHPDSETLQRLLHRHGGDLEKYETSRVTHILAEQLSTAKANMYKRQRNAKPVCRPVWIVDCVRAQKLLPHTDYLLNQIRDDAVVGTKSLKTFFASKSSGPVVCSLQQQYNDAEIDTTGMKTCHRESVNVPRREVEETGINSVNENERVMHITNKSPQIKIGIVDEGKHHFEDSAENVGPVHATSSSTTNSSTLMKTDKYINGRIRTVGTDPNFLESFFAASRLSFIGSYKQRTRRSPQKKSASLNVPTERLIFHVDMDSFFASVVLRNYPEYRDKPVVISHHGGDRNNKNASRDAVPNNSSSECATCNYEARKYGIQKGMFLGRAKSLCPDLIILQYDFEGYGEVSESVAEILYRYAADYDGFVEQVSCDESYVEFYFPMRCGEESKSISSMASQVAERIRQEIFDATQCTATIGVGSNKLLAKLATDHVKPNKSFVVDDYKDLLRPLNLRDLHGIGYRLERKLEDEGLVTVQDVWDMGSCGETELCRILGPGLGKKIFGYCIGRDDRPVQPADRKTIGAECNYGVRFDGPYGADHMIEGLCREVEKRMACVGVKGMKLTLKVKQRKAGAPPPPKFLGHGSCHNLSHSSDLSNSTATREWKDLFAVAMKIFVELNVPVDDIRGMGIVVSKLVSDDANNYDQFAAKQSIEKWLMGPNAITSDRQLDIIETKDKRGRVRFSETVEHSDYDQLDERAVQPSISRDIHDTPVGTEQENIFCDNPVPRSCAEESESNEFVVTEQDDLDIAIPSLSQIHMSQVVELPSPIRNHIRSKIEQQMANKNGKDFTRASSEQKSSRFFQTDVQRMFRLAAVKTGEQPLEHEPGLAVSLSQLNCLPFEVQLQLANNDKRRMGFLSPEKKKLARVGVTAGKYESQHIKKRDEIKLINESINAVEFSVDETPSDPRAFYSENVLPLRVFMDENPVCDQATALVTSFLSICVTESRVPDVIVLLRSIKNRNDAWGKYTFESIWLSVKSEIESYSGSQLDIEWALQTTYFNG